MIGIRFVGGTKDQREAVAQLRRGATLATAAKRSKLGDVDAVIHAYELYLSERIAVAAGPERARINEQYLDRLDYLIERHYEAAAAGCPGSTRLVVTLIESVARLRERFTQQEVLRRATAPLGDAAKGKSGDTLRDRWEMLVRLRDQEGVPIPPEVALAFQQLLSAGVAHGGD